MKTLLLPPNLPFLLPRTEKPEGSQYPVEGLVEDTYLYLTPTLGKESYNGKKYYDKSDCTFTIVKGLFKDNKLFFIPKDAVGLHGDMFCFNRPKQEDDDTANKAQDELLKKWGKYCCVTVLECSEHNYLSKLAKEFDGYYLPEQDFTVVTEPSKFSDLPNTEQKKWEEIKPKLVGEINNEEERDELTDDDNIAMQLGKRGLLPIVSNKEPKVTPSKLNRSLGNDLIDDIIPDECIALEDYATKFSAPKSSGNYGGNKKGGGYYSPEQRLEFVKGELKKAGINTDNVYSIIYDCLGDPIKWLALQFTMNVSGSYTPNWELPNLELEHEPTEESQENNIKEEGNTKLKQWVEDNKDNLYGQGFEDNINVSSEWEELWLDICEVITPWDTETKRKIKEVTGKSITKKSGGWLGLEVDDLKKIKTDVANIAF